MARILTAALSAALLLCAATAASRPFTVDDLLREESFGGVEFDPSGRWLVLERRDRYDTAPRFDYYLNTSTALTRPLVVDLTHPGPARPLLADEADPGVVVGAFSPSGARLAVYRLQDHRWRLGVVTLTTGAVRWFDLTPDQVRAGRSLQWLSDDRLLVIDCADGVAPWRLHEGWISADRLPSLWEASAAGKASYTVLGSGAYASLRQRPAPRRLLRLDVNTGAHETLAAGELIDLEVSPNGRRVALFEAGEDIQSRPDGPVQGAAGTATQATHLSLLDLRTGRRTSVCPRCDFLSTLLAWSPRGDALLGFVRGADGLWTDGRFHRVDAATARAEPVGPDLRPVMELRPEYVRAGWMGGRPVALARRASEPAGRPDWYGLEASSALKLSGGLPTVPASALALDARGLAVLVAGAVWRVGPSGATRRLAAGLSTAVRAGSRSWGGRLAYAAAPSTNWVINTALGGRTVSLVTPDGVRLRLPAGSSGEVVAASRAAPAIAVLTTDAHGVGALSLVRPGQAPLTLSNINDGLFDVDPPRILPVRHIGPNGQALTSWLYLPAPAPGAPPPLIIKPYPGDNYPTPPTSRAADQAGFMGDIRILVGHGYAVLTPSLPRSAEPEGPMAGLADRILAVEAAARADPALAGAYDPARLGLLGYSFGGMSTMAVISQTQRFRAAVSLSGVSDLISIWASLHPSYRTAPEMGVQANWSSGNTESGQMRLGAPPWRDVARYTRNSPLLSADKVQTPLLLFHGDQDVAPLSQSEGMFAALYRQSKDAILVTYWGEGHVYTSPGNVRDMYARTFQFLDEHLSRSETSARAASPGPVLASSAPRPLPTRPRGSP